MIVDYCANHSFIATRDSLPGTRETARRLHAAEHALMSGDAEIRDAAIRKAGETVRAAHQAGTSTRSSRPRRTATRNGRRWWGGIS